jgi:nitrous oxidase accessory protein NosD
MKRSRSSFIYTLFAALTLGFLLSAPQARAETTLNGYKIGNLAAGADTDANGIFASDKKNITIRNGIIRGFYHGINLFGSSSSGHLVEDMNMDGNTFRGIYVYGTGATVRNNRVVNTGGSTGNTNGLGIQLLFANGATVVNNTVSNTFATGGGSVWGMVIEGSSHYATVKDNRVSSSTAVSGLVYGIFLSSASITAENNIVSGSSTSDTAYGIYATSSSTYNHIIGNRISDADIGAYCSSSTTEARDNSFTAVTTPISGCTNSGNNT